MPGPNESVFFHFAPFWGYEMKVISLGGGRGALLEGHQKWSPQPETPVSVQRNEVSEYNSDANPGFQARL